MPGFVNEFEALAESFERLDARVRCFATAYSLNSGRVQFSGYYPTIKQNVATVSELVRTIKLYIISFAIPRERRSRVFNASYTSQVEKEAAFQDLADEAAELFIKAKKGDHRSGDAGELLLYLMLEKYRGAPQIVSKFYLKTSFNMPVHGTDGIHIGRNSAGELCVYWGESKAYATLVGAVTGAMESISKFVDQDEQQAELRLVNKFIDIGDDPELKEKIREYTDPYNEKYNLSKIVFAIMLLYNDKNYSCDPLTDENFAQKASSELKSFEAKFVEILQKFGVQKLEFDCFFLPLPCVQDFRDKFQSLIGVKDA